MKCFGFRQCRLDAAHRVYHIDKCVKIHFGITIHFDSKIRDKRLVEQLNAAERIRSVELPAAVFRYRHIHVTHQRSYFQFFVFHIQRCNHHRIRTPCCPLRILLIGILVCSYEKHVDDIRIFYGIILGDIHFIQRILCIKIQKANRTIQLILCRRRNAAERHTENNANYKKNLSYNFFLSFTILFCFRHSLPPFLLFPFVLFFLNYDAWVISSETRQDS